jgi:hypothetical protein
VWQAAVEKLIQYDRNDEEKERLIAKHRDVLNKMLDADDELNDLLLDSDDQGGAPMLASPSPAAVTTAVTDVDLEESVQ